MTRAIRNTSVVAALLGLAAGAALGYRGVLDRGAMEFSVSTAASSASYDFAVQQFEHAGTDDARRAALLQIGILNKLDRATHDRMYTSELGFAYTRLALIEDVAGNAQAATQAFEQARERFREAHPGQALSDDQMKANLKAFDGASDKLY